MQRNFNVLVSSKMNNLEGWFGGPYSERFNVYEFKSAGLIEKCEGSLDLEKSFSFA
jgi:hypothetical protein